MYASALAVFGKTLQHEGGLASADFLPWLVPRASLPRGNVVWAGEGHFVYILARLCSCYAYSSETCHNASCSVVMHKTFFALATEMKHRLVSVLACAQNTRHVW